MRSAVRTVEWLLRLLQSETARRTAIIGDSRQNIRPSVMSPVQFVSLKFEA